MATTFTAERADGYRGIWYMNQPTGDAHRYKYSGGFATYPQQHVPIAVYDKRVEKTFFVFGGATEKNELLHMVSYFDHRTRTVPRPAVLLNKRTDDAHDNPTLAIDGEGHLWVFSNAHGTSRPSFIHRSARPFAIDAWEKVLETNYSYGQPWWCPGRGFLFLHTRYGKGRGIFAQSSRDGRTWEEPRPLAHIAQGHYQVSWPDPRREGRLVTVFDYHPATRGGQPGLNFRTNLYLLLTEDWGRTWRTIAGDPVTTPLTEVNNPALVHDYAAEGLLVYLKDVTFDAEDCPVILYLTSRGFEPGAKSGSRAWQTARWTGREWERRPVTTSDHNYDHGSLFVEADGAWRIIAPTESGPQPEATGGEMALWLSRDQGATWKREKMLTRNSPRNHTYARRPLHAHPDFYALWADGNPVSPGPSPSNLYFTDREGSRVWRLPERMTGDAAAPEPMI